MLLKTAFREIKTSLGRYLAILAIIALGVGFFAGLRVTRTAMISTANHYLKDLAMFDDRILSTLGWTEEDVDAFRKLDGVSAAEGARSADVLCVGEDGSDMVLKAHSLTQQVNRLSLQAGRLPEKADECVVDAWRYDESALGSVIRLSDNNSADTMDTFASREYTVVGVAASPMYVNYERGGTALGNGTVAAFVYLLPEGFAMDYYTEIDVTLTGADGRIYTAAYDDVVEAMEQPLKDLAAQRAQLRYDSLRSEAQEKLADAQQQLDDARKQLETGWTEYYDGLAQYKDGHASYIEGAGQYRDGLAEYDSGRAAYETARKDYENGVSQYNQGQAGYEEGQRQYQAAQAQYQEALAQYQLLEQQAAALPEDSPELPVLQAKLAAMKEQLDATAAQLSQNQAQLEATAAQLAQSKAQLDAAGAALDDTERQLTQAREKLEESARQLAAAKAQLEETGPKLESARQELEDGERELSDHEGELDDARQKLEDLKEPDTYVLGRDTNVGYVCFESDTNIVAGVSRVFPLFFFLLAALVCITTMTRMVEEQRTQLGVLMAMGYGRGAILFKYFFYSGSASLLGCAIGFLGFAKGIAAAIDVSSTVTTWLFIGLIVGTVPSLFREAGKEGRSIGSWVSMAVCAGAIFFSLFYVGKVICVTVEPNFWWYNFCGALWGMSLVIPGLTSSSVMMALGLYQPMLEGLARLDFLVLSACLPGMVLTILLLARLVSWFFRKHYSIAFHGIFGIVLASTLVIIPTSYVGAWEIVLSAVCCIGGFLLAYFMARLDRRIQENGRA